MNKALVQLIRKDARAMIPVGLVFMTIALVWIVQYFVLAAPMDASWAAVSVLSSGSFLSLVHVLIGLMAAYLLLPREFDDGTLQFLWGLPVDRWQIVMAKIIAAVSVVVVGSLALALFAYGLTGFARNSIGSEVFSWSTWWLHFTITAGSSLVGLGYGVLACFSVGSASSSLRWPCSCLMCSADSCRALANTRSRRSDSSATKASSRR